MIVDSVKFYAGAILVLFMVLAISISEKVVEMAGWIHRRETWN